MICASGIGVTPLAAALKSTIRFRWKYSVGHAFPDRANFFWVTSHTEVESFRWIIRTIKEIDDDYYDMAKKSPEVSFSF
jgi:hypothetical protein